MNYSVCSIHRARRPRSLFSWPNSLLLFVTRRLGISQSTFKEYNPLFDVSFSSPITPERESPRYPRHQQNFHCYEPPLPIPAIPSQSSLQLPPLLTSLPYLFSSLPIPRSQQFPSTYPYIPPSQPTKPKKKGHSDKTLCQQGSYPRFWVRS